MCGAVTKAQWCVDNLIRNSGRTIGFLAVASMMTGSGGGASKNRTTFCPSGSMAVEMSCPRNLLSLLRRHFSGILSARHTARPEFCAGDLVLG
jgi:hypothetical protein